MKAYDFIKKNIGARVIVSQPAPMESEMKRLVYKRVPLEIVELTRGGMALLKEIGGKQYHSIAPRWVREIDERGRDQGRKRFSTMLLFNEDLKEDSREKDFDDICIQDFKGLNDMREVAYEDGIMYCHLDGKCKMFKFRYGTEIYYNESIKVRNNKVIALIYNCFQKGQGGWNCAEDEIEYVKEMTDIAIRLGLIKI